MIALISIFLLTSFKSIENIISLRTFISNNVQGKTELYSICSDLDEIFCLNYKAKSFIDFLAYLTKIGVEYTVSDKYIIFQKVEPK
jgi:hypothetical protein